MASFDLSTIARKNILELTPYRCARDDYSDGILLDANENSIGPAVSSHSHLELNRYPDPLHLGVKQKFAALKGHGVRKEQVRLSSLRQLAPHSLFISHLFIQVFFGVGSDEAIDILFRIFCNPRVDNVVITPPTYGMYKVCAKVNDVQVKIANLTPSFDVDVDLVLSTIDEKTKLVFLCSPGNPTAKTIPNDVVEQIVSRFSHGIVVVDEAYIDFSQSVSACALVSKCPNVIVLQTLSKAFGLAGIRLGAAIGNADIIQLMNNIKAPYNINKLTIEVADEALSNLTLYKENVQKILFEREYLLSELRKLKFVLKIHATDANFILFEVSSQSQLIYKTMADRGIVCRYRGMEMHCNECLRVTVGTHDENVKFISMIQKVADELAVV